MVIRNQSKLVYLIWGALIAALVVALFTMQWMMAFVSLATLILSVLPSLFVARFQITLPQSFIAVIVVFVFATVFLGEAFDFYHRYWWWDIAMHGISSIGFGLVGFLFVFMLFAGDRYAAPPIALAFIAYCVAIAIGTGWEIFEFAMDQIFGMNMQKSGLMDTMGDLVVNMIGAMLGAAAGFLFQKGRRFGGLSGMIRQFVQQNRHFYHKDRD